MTVDDYKIAMHRELLAAGFEFNRPDPAVAWAVFQRHAADPVECDDSYLFWEAAGDYFDFVREFEQGREAGVVWYEQLTIQFTCSPLENLGVEPVVVFSRDYPDYAAFFKAVEQRPEFAKGLAFGRWSAEVRHDGC